MLNSGSDPTSAGDLKVSNIFAAAVATKLRDKKLKWDSKERRHFGIPEVFCPLVPLPKRS